MTPAEAEARCDAEVKQGLDCHECGHSMNCVFCCTNDMVEGIEEERDRLEMDAKLK